MPVGAVGEEGELDASPSEELQGLAGAGQRLDRLDLGTEVFRDGPARSSPRGQPCRGMPRSSRASRRRRLRLALLGAQAILLADREEAFLKGAGSLAVPQNTLPIQETGHPFGPWARDNVRVVGPAGEPLRPEPDERVSVVEDDAAQSRGGSVHSGYDTRDG